jgi:phosphatidylinositol dimannoside acyltransferase
VNRIAVRERVAYWIFRGGRWLARSLPERAGRRTFETSAVAVYRTVPRVRETVRRNQAQVLGLPESDPRVEASTREAFRLYGRYWQETFWAPTIGEATLLERFRCEGYEHIEAAMTAGSGAIAALPHLGNWDVAGRWMGVMGTPVVSVAEELRPAELYEMFVENRRSMGIDVLPLGANGQVGRQLAAALASNRVVALVADRHLGGRGVEVEMFGRARRMPAGPAMLSIATHAPLIAAAVYTTDRGWRCVMNEPIRIEPTGDRKKDAEALTRRLAASFERAISAAPADWHLFLPGWEP